MAAVLDSPFLCNYQDLRGDEEEFGMNPSRWSVQYPRLSVFPGEIAMREDAQQEQLATFHSLRLTPAADWREQTHIGRDMHSFSYQQTISPLSDEQRIFGYSPEHNENEFYQLNTENTSPQAILGLQDIYSDNVLEDDSIMFDNSNYSDLDKEMKSWLPSLSETESIQTPTPDRNREFLPHTCTQSSFAPLFTKEEKKPLVKSRLSIFDSEEPLIKEDPDMSSSQFGECDIKYELEVAAEEEVVTEASSPQSQSCAPTLKSEWYDSSKLDLFKEEPKEEPVSPASAMDNADDLLVVSDVEDFPSSQELNVDWSTGPMLPPAASRLRLDIGAAMVNSSELFGHSLVDTPEVLKPVLKPLGDFDLISFLLANGDSNNNAVLPATPVETDVKPLHNSLLERRRQGKSQLSMQELRASQLSDEKPSRSIEDTDPLVQRLAAESSRPHRQSASRFNLRLEEGLYEDVPLASDDEDFTPTSKRRRTTSSSSSRRHTNYDSDISNVVETYQKYRERRDRNNVSSKMSRQKRKMTQQQKVMEMKELERQNLRLKRKEQRLSSVLERANLALKEYLGRIPQ